MKVLPKLLTILIISLLLFSCVTKQGKDAKYSVYVTNEAKFQLLSPSAFEENMDRFQNITGYFQDKVHIFGAYIKSDDEQVAITFFNQMGGSVGDLLYTGESLQANSHFFPPAAKFEYMMADFQFCYCQKELLLSSLEAIGLRFDVIEQDGKEIRQIWDKEQLVIQVEKEKNHTKLQNFLRQYSYDIQEGT
jgi:hypothetical protein